MIVKKVAFILFFAFSLAFLSSNVSCNEYAETIRLEQVINENGCCAAQISQIIVSNSNEVITLTDDEINRILSLINDMEFVTYCGDAKKAKQADSAIVINFDDVRLMRVRILNNGEVYMESAYPVAKSSMSPPVAISVNAQEVELLINNILKVHPSLTEYYTAATSIKFNGEYIRLGMPSYIIYPVERFF